MVLHTARRLKLDEINQQAQAHEETLRALSPRPSSPSGREAAVVAAEPPRLMMTEQEKRENEEMTRLLEAETQRFEAEKERNTAMSKELLSTVEEIDSRESRWSAVKSKLGLGFLEGPKQVPVLNLSGGC